MKTTSLSSILVLALSACGVLIEQNQVNAYGSAIFFVSNNHTGNIVIRDSILRNNTGGGWNRAGFPGISAHDDPPIAAQNSTFECFPRR